MNKHADPGSPAVPAAEPGGPESSGAEDKRIAFIVSLHVKPGCEAEFLRLLMPVLDAMRHESTFINAALHRDPADPTRFMLYETWTDLDDVKEVQIHRDYRQAYLARLPEILREPRQVQFWQPLRGDFTFFAGVGKQAAGREAAVRLASL
jgi:quinol monooxygenase YgiN